MDAEHVSADLAKRIVRAAAGMAKEEPDGMPAMQEALRNIGELPDAAALLDCVRRLDQHPDALAALLGAYVSDGADAGDGRIEVTESSLSALADYVLAAWLEESLTALWSFLPAAAPFSGEDHVPTFIFCSIHQAAAEGVRGDLVVGFISPDVGPVFWERHDFAVPTLLPALFCRAFDVSVIRCAFGRVQRAFSPGPLFHLHPERFRQTRYYSDAIVSLYPGGGLPLEEDFQRLSELATDEMGARLSEVDLRARLARDVPMMVVLDSEACLAMAWAKFVGAGRQIFVVPPSMVGMMRHTDIDDVPVDMLRLPYPVLYLHFGAQADLEVAPGWRVDGAYVEHHPAHRLLTFTLTTRPADDSEVDRWHAFGEPELTLSLPEAVAGYDLGTAIDHQIAARLNELRAERDAAPEMMAAAAAAEQARGLPAGSIRITTGQRAAAQEDQTRASAVVLREGMRLAVNVLCYLTAYPDDVAPEWPEGTPDRLRRQAASGTPRERLRARSKLESMGYSSVNICGQRFASLAGSGAPIVHGAVRPHWRRGHWRRQAYGEGKRLRRIIWIMPTMVSGTAIDLPDTKGHIYRVEA